MILTPNLVRQAIISPGTQSIWNDSTVYGGSGPLRTALALYLTAYKMDENQVATTLAVTSFNPETVTSFTTVNTIDGWYKYPFVIVPYWNVGVQNIQYDLVWDHGTLGFYKYINASPSTGNPVTNPTYFSAITDPTTVITNVGTSQESTNIIYQVINKVVDFQTSVCYLKAASKHAKHTCDSDSCGCDSRTGKYLHKIRDLFAVLAVNESTGQFIEGEKNARLVEKYCSDCGCISR